MRQKRRQIFFSFFFTKKSLKKVIDQQKKDEKNSFFFIFKKADSVILNDSPGIIISNRYAHKHSEKLSKSNEYLNGKAKIKYFKGVYTLFIGKYYICKYTLKSEFLMVLLHSLV